MPIRTRATSLAVLMIACLVASVTAWSRPAPVTLTETKNLYILDNGIVTAEVAKDSGDLVSLRYKGLEMFATILKPDGQPDLQKDPPGENLHGLNPGMTDHQYGFWSHDAMGQRGSKPAAVDRVTIDPRTNGGERAEVSIEGISDGRKMGTGPGSHGGNFIADIDIRYTLGRGDSGIYTYCSFHHPARYGATTLTEARFCMKLNSFFDWMLVDQHHHMYYPAERERKGDDKYNYTSDQFDHRAYGWASSTKHVGCFIVNPSVEYLSGGPTKVEFLCHRDTNRVAAPCVLNYWRSSHYGGSSVDVAKGENWTKVVGPFLIYCNSGGDPISLWHDALAKARSESRRWPYDWVHGVDYPHRAERAVVTGRLVLHDPLMPGAKMSHILVGLTHPDYHITVHRAAGSDTPVNITWMTDAKHYEFWVRADADGRFSIPAVRAGHYSLHAIADGVLGQFTRKDVTVRPGESLDLGVLRWTPVRDGRQLWDIGIPNRNASEFLEGDNYFHDNMALDYARRFPHGVDYTIGKSDYRKDWYFQQVPQITDIPAAMAAIKAREAAFRRFIAMYLAGKRFPPGQRPKLPPPVQGKADPWSIHFKLAKAPHGTATLRVAIAGGSTSNHQIAVTVNGQPAGVVKVTGDSTVGRNGIQGIWYQRAVPFPASMMHAGENVLTLTVPAGGLTQGVVYDYLRLELDEHPKTQP